MWMFQSKNKAPPVEEEEKREVESEVEWVGVNGDVEDGAVQDGDEVESDDSVEWVGVNGDGVNGYVEDGGEVEDQVATAASKVTRTPVAPTPHSVASKMKAGVGARMTPAEKRIALEIITTTKKITKASTDAVIKQLNADAEVKVKEAETKQQEAKNEAERQANEKQRLKDRSVMLNHLRAMQTDGNRSLFDLFPDAADLVYEDDDGDIVLNNVNRTLFDDSPEAKVAHTKDPLPRSDSKPPAKKDPPSSNSKRPPMKAPPPARTPRAKKAPPPAANDSKPPAVTTTRVNNSKPPAVTTTRVNDSKPPAVTTTTTVTTTRVRVVHATVKYKGVKEAVLRVSIVHSLWR